jgi:hypothetical protein
MDLTLDAWIQLTQVTLLLILITQSFGLRERLKALEAKLRDQSGKG